MTPQPEFMDAAEAARQLHITFAELHAMAIAGQYCELLHVTKRRYLVRRSDHEAWMADRWTKAELARAELQEARMREAKLIGRQA